MMSIQFLDCLADADWTDERTDAAIKEVIKAIGILIGFSWEQCFDQAVESLAEATPKTMQHTAKMILGLFCVFIIVPAWKWHLLPMAIRDGWKLGFVIDIDDHRTSNKWGDIVKHLEDAKKKMTHNMKKVAAPEGSASKTMKKSNSCTDMEYALLGGDAEWADEEAHQAEVKKLQEANDALRQELWAATRAKTAASSVSSPSGAAKQQKIDMMVRSLPPSAPSSNVRSRSVGTTLSRRADNRDICAKVDRLEELTRRLLGSVDK
jgi:hypothetical protein